MKILHFGSNYLPKQGGNVVRMTKMLENNHCGNELFVLTTTPQQSFDDDSYYKDTNIRVFRLSKLTTAYRLLPSIVKQYRIDIVVTHTIPANLIACICLPQSVEIITEVHSLIESPIIKQTIKDTLHQLFLKHRTKYFLTLSKGAMNYIQKHYGVCQDKIIFLPNGFDHDAPLSRKPGNPKYFTFGYVGTFYTWQGIEVIRENIDRIISIGEDVRIFLVGGGQQEEKIKQMESKFKGRLVVTGMLSKIEADRMTSEIDVLIIPRPSTLETETAIPLKIFESVTYGKPVIISDVFGLTEIFSEKEAYVYNKLDSDGLYNMCCEAYKDRNSLDNKYDNALHKLSSWPDWVAIHELQNEVYKRVKSKK